jgi:ATP-dependent DNA helicase RecG
VAEELSKLFPDRVGLLHGKLRSSVKDDILRQFASGELSILVATTVVEVGIGAEQFVIFSFVSSRF